MLSLYREIFLDHGYEVAGLGDAPVILDCGGNIGLASRYFSENYTEAAVLCMPVHAILTAAGNRFFSAGWDLKDAAESENADDYGPGGFAGLRPIG
jgi:hypothetical protein